MSNDKKYSELEVAEMIKVRLIETMKKHEEMAKNSAHDIDAGGEPNNDDAECPDYLANSLAESGSSESSDMEYSESSNMEDEALSDYDNDEDEDEDSEKKKKKDDDSEDDSESDEEDYSFVKSEACGHTIEYKTLRKDFAGFGSVIGGGTKEKPSIPDSEDTSTKTRTGSSSGYSSDGRMALSEDNADIHHSDEGGLATPTSDAQNSTFTASIKGKKGSKKGHKDDSSPGQDEGKRQARDRRNRSKEATAAGKPDSLGLEDSRKKKGTIEDRQSDIGHRASKFDKDKGINSRKKDRRERGDGHYVPNKKSEVKETKGIELDNENVSDKGKEEKKGIKRPIEKCGDMAAAKLSKFLSKEKK